MLRGVAGGGGLRLPHGLRGIRELLTNRQFPHTQPLTAVEHPKLRLSATARLPPGPSQQQQQRSVQTSAPAMVSAPASFARIAPDVVRFDHAADAAYPPSVSFENHKVREGEGVVVDGNSNSKGQEPEFLPSFSKEGERYLPEGTSCYGTGEVAGTLLRTGKKVETWNTDAYGYDATTPALYQSHPWVLALLPDGRSIGVLADTTYMCEVDLRDAKQIRFAVKSQPFPVVVFGPFSHPEDVVKSLCTFTGMPAMPPKWAVGYHQCRWSYEPDAQVLEIAKGFRDRNIPCDTLWMDIDYMDGFRCFTFDTTKFPDPEGLASRLHASGFRAVWMIDPGIKAEKGYSVYESGSTNKAWVQREDGKSEYQGEVWPGMCAFPDYTNVDARKWWASEVASFMSRGVDGIWNDMNEPAVFRVASKTMPLDNVHRADEELGGRGPHAQYHNVFGMQMVRATREGMLQGKPNNRPFVLTRANFLGGHRYAATWTGDNVSDWDHLAYSIPMCLNLGLSGQPFSGPDIGGFGGNCRPLLYARWIALGSLLPFSRTHSEKGSVEQEPWSFGAEVEEISRRAIARRYRLLPHIYTLFHNAHTTGAPVMTPAFFADPKDTTLRGVEDTYLLGPVLVACNVGSGDPKPASEVRLPASSGWARFHFDDFHPELPHMYLHHGCVVPAGPTQQHVDEKPLDPLTLIVALDERGKASGELYEDAGDGFEYGTNEEYLITTYEAHTVPNISPLAKTKTVEVKVGSHKGKLPRPEREVVVRLLLGEGAEVTASGKDGSTIKVEIPSDEDVAHLRAENAAYEAREADKYIPLRDEVRSRAKKAPKRVEMKTRDIKLATPFAGGRLCSMLFGPNNIELLSSNWYDGGYEEYSTHEYRSAGCTEAYVPVSTELDLPNNRRYLAMEAELSGGLVFARKYDLGGNLGPNTLRITSSIEARSVGAGSAGASRPVCLRVHPTFQCATETSGAIEFVALDGSEVTITSTSGGDGNDIVLTGDSRPNGVWKLIDTERGYTLTNRFDVTQVNKCMLHWSGDTVSLELWSEERPCTASTPLVIAHEYQVDAA
eukprot:jgi/Chlat1/3302/Chrsp22S03466